jgi:hypothetical protein
MYGHSGYTGTIAEKQIYYLIPTSEYVGREPQNYAQELIDKNDKRVSDKWGPCGAIQLTKNKWLFFGWASS